MGNKNTKETLNFPPKTLRSISNPALSFVTVPSFETLPELPIPYTEPQCVWFNKRELLICGGYENPHCYSYHLLKRQYKFICSYPEHILLQRHVVIKQYGGDNFDPHIDHNDYLHTNQNHNHHNNDNTFNDNDKGNEITLLSFGGQDSGQDKYTLVMNYESVWNVNLRKIKEKIYITNQPPKNVWLPARYNIGNKEDDMRAVRALIIGSKNQLLFIIHRPNRIMVLDLKTLQSIANATLPINFFGPSCLVRTSGCYTPLHKMIMFYLNEGLSITHDEEACIFQYEKLPVISELKESNPYSFFYFSNHVILLRGQKINEVFVYSTKRKEWKVCAQYGLPVNLQRCFAIMDHDNKYIHIVGGFKQHYKIEIKTLIRSTADNIKTVVNYWVRNNILKFGWIEEFDSIVVAYLL